MWIATSVLTFLLLCVGLHADSDVNRTQLVCEPSTCVFSDLHFITPEAMDGLSIQYDSDYYNTVEFVQSTIPALSPAFVQADVQTLTIIECDLYEIAPNTFKKAKDLKNLYLVGNRLQTLYNGTFYLYLENNRLASLDGGLFINLRELKEVNLNGNEIKELRAGALKGASKLTKLTINYNDIKQIDEHFLDDTPLLESFSIEDNFVERIPIGLFRNQTRLADIFLSNNLIPDLQPGTFDGLVSDAPRLFLARNLLERVEGTVFNVSNLEFLDLEKNFIRDIPEAAFEAFANLAELLLSENFIDRIPEALNRTTKLINLILRNNRIAAVTEGQFSQLTQLATLNLYDNVIEVLENGSFRGLDNLEWLSLQRNEIAAVPSALFDDLPNLQNLYLDNTNFSPLNNTYFKQLQNLNLIKLGANNMSMAGNEFLYDLSSLKEIYLENTGALYNGNHFKTLQSLEIISLINNSITAINEDFFAGTPNLMSIDLTENPLTSIGLKTFYGLKNLTELFIGPYSGELKDILAGNKKLTKNNSIETLDPFLFSDTPRLKVIDLSYNKLSNLDDRLFVNQLALEELDLSNNWFTTFNLPQKSFVYSLKKLFVDSNSLTSLKITPNLEELKADNNHLTTIEVDVSSYYKLTKLSAQKNHFTSVSPAYPFYNLEELNLAQNPIVGIHLPTIKNKFPRLNVLNVSLAAIETLGSVNEVNQTRLEVLDISNNTLTADELEKVKYLPQLQSFIFGGNLFDSFTADVVLNNLPKLKKIGLSGSELRCSFTKYIEEIAKELHYTVETFSGTAQWDAKCGPDAEREDSTEINES
uniref:Uncharacterized protein n=1 Tax=Anopheles atroparvus TaxID=41427 RepID=A0A182IM70_ANOAO